MNKLIREGLKVYGQYQTKGVRYLDSFDSRPILESTLNTIKFREIEQYVNEEFKPKADISVFPLHKDPQLIFRVSLFILTSSVRMPLHDHPEMWVLTHVLQGRIKKESYDILGEDQRQQIEFPHKQPENGKLIEKITQQKAQPRIVKAFKHPDQMINKGDQTFTKPSHQNLHRFINVTKLYAERFKPQLDEKQLFVFLDVILPPYDQERRFRNIYETTSQHNELLIKGVPKEQNFDIQEMDGKPFINT